MDKASYRVACPQKQIMVYTESHTKSRAGGRGSDEIDQQVSLAGAVDADKT